MSITLTGEQIKNLAEIVGFTISDNLSDDEREDFFGVEIVIVKNPDGSLMDEDGVLRQCTHFAYYAEYPDEGIIPI